jgi:thymidylate kinase
VAVLGPDGAGKGTIISELVSRIPIGLTVVYLGSGSSGTPGRTTRSRGEGAGRARRAGPVRESAFLLWKAIRGWRRLLRGYAAAWRGHIVLCDRHPMEILAILPERTRAGAALERFLARRLTPRPDAIVVLDAPAEVLRSRKQEHPIGTLERWRSGYATVFGSNGAMVVSTAGPLEDSVSRVSDVLWQALRRRRGW